MGLEENKRIARRLIEEDLNTADPAVDAQIVSPDFFDHTNPPELQHGLAGHNGIVSYFRSAFPDSVWTIDDMFAEGDLVGLRLSMTGTHDGEFFGLAPTGAHVEFSGTHVLRIVDGKILEHWGHNDDMGLMRQLGAIPDPQGAEA